MLVLSRPAGESIVIGEDIVVTVLVVRGDVVRLGVHAPRHVAVHCEELLRELAESNRAAASPSDLAIADLSHLVSSRRAVDDGNDPIAGHLKSRYAPTRPVSRRRGSGRPTIGVRDAHTNSPFVAVCHDMDHGR